MRKLSVLLIAAMALFSNAMYAQVADNNMFNHLGVGVSVGTDGIGFDVAAPIGNYVQARAGYTFIPSIKPTITVGYDRTKNGVSTHYEDDAQLTIKKGDFKILFDVYPFKNSNFRVTAGAFIGGSEIATLRNKGPLSGVEPDEYGTAKISLNNAGTLEFGTDPEGNVKARVKVGGFKPYLGVGFGRSVPNKLVSVSCDLGVQFWGSPKAEVYDYNVIEELSGWREIKKDDFDKTYSKDEKDAYNGLKLLGNIVVYPTINVRVGFRAF